MAKYLGLQSLPGGYRNYKIFILKVLAKIFSRPIQRSELLEWIKSEFKLSGTKAPKWYIHTLFSLGLVRESESGLSLSEAGRKFLSTQDDEIILKKLLENFAGFQEILALLQSKAGASSSEIHKMLRSTCGFVWMTDTQTSKRLLWLRALGYVETDGRRRHYLTEKGRKVASAITSM
jgi:hypothetical protein